MNLVAGGWSPWDPFLGGTEEYVVETARGLARRGFAVRVCHNGRHGEYDGVAYLPHERFVGEDIVLAVKQRPPRLGQRNLFYTNDIHHRAVAFDDFDHVIALSHWHADHLLGRTPKVQVIWHACWPGKYRAAAKVPRSCLYASSPDRGLVFLLSQWPRVHAATGATLTVTYGAQLSHPMPGVTCTGKVTAEHMDDLFRQSQFWLHPCTGVELFCISGAKAQAAGCIPVIVPAMALDETVRVGVKTTLARYHDDLIAALHHPPPLSPVHVPSWDDVTDQLVSLF